MPVRYLLLRILLAGVALISVSCAPAPAPTPVATQAAVPTAAPAATVAPTAAPTATTAPTTAPTAAPTASVAPVATKTPSPAASQGMALPTLMPKVPGAPEEIQRIKPEELKVLLDGGADLEVVDVQSQADYANRHIPGATSLIWAEQIDNPRALSKDRLLVIYCNRPNGEFAADVAMQLITKYGYTKIMLLEGGLKAWGEDLDYPLERSFFD